MMSKSWLRKQADAVVIEQYAALCAADQALPLGAPRDPALVRVQYELQRRKLLHFKEDQACTR